MGFSRNYAKDASTTLGPLYYRLYSPGTKLFSTYFTDAASTSFVDFATYSTTYMSFTTTRWITVQNVYYWTASTTGVTVGGNQFKFAVSADFIFDSGSGLGYMPYKYGNAIMKKLLKGVTSIKWFGRWYTSCNTAKFTSLFFLIGGYWIEIPPGAFLWSASGNSNGGRYSCITGFATHSSNTFYFGNVLLRNYYTVWDDANSRIWLAPRTSGLVTTEATGTTPTKELKTAWFYL
jgi:Eukaryotic aspartyl protease